MRLEHGIGLLARSENANRLPLFGEVWMAPCVVCGTVYKTVSLPCIEFTTSGSERVFGKTSVVCKMCGLETEIEEGSYP